MLTDAEKLAKIEEIVDRAYSHGSPFLDEDDIGDLNAVLEGREPEPREDEGE